MAHENLDPELASQYWAVLKRNDITLSEVAEALCALFIIIESFFLVSMRDLCLWLGKRSKVYKSEKNKPKNSLQKNTKNIASLGRNVLIARVLNPISLTML